MLRFPLQIGSLVAAVGVCLGVASPGGAQTAVELTRRGYAPVEPIVEDLEPLRTGLRNLQVGLGPQGQDSVVFQNAADTDARFFVVTPGLTVSYDRSQYIYIENRRKRQWGVFMLVPPNTLYHIGLPPDLTTPPEAHNPNRIDDTVAHQPIAPAATLSARTVPRGDPAAEQRLDELTRWATWARVRQAAQRDVLAAFDRVAAGL